MKISNVSSKPAAAKTPATKKSGGTSFLSHLSESDGAKDVSSSSDVSPVIAVNSLFALQEVDNEQSPRKKMITRGFDMVQHLDDIRMGLLTGEVSVSTLKNLDILVKQWREADHDSNLEEIINEIELRAAVELAKLEMDTNN